MRLLDTGTLIDIQRGHQPAVGWFASLDELPSVPGFVAMELYQGASDARREREVEDMLAPLAIVWPSETDCQRALMDFRALHLSHGLGLLDALIAATAIGLGATDIQHPSFFSGFRSHDRATLLEMTGWQAISTRQRSQRKG